MKRPALLNPFLLIAALLTLSACGGTAFTDRPLDCSDIQQLCFRGALLDPAASRDRYGSDGHRAVLHYRNDF